MLGAAEALGGVFLHGCKAGERLFDAAVEVLELLQNLVVPAIEFEKRIGRFDDGERHSAIGTKGAVFP